MVAERLGILFLKRAGQQKEGICQSMQIPSLLTLRSLFHHGDNFIVRIIKMSGNYIPHIFHSFAVGKFSKEFSRGVGGDKPFNILSLLFTHPRQDKGGIFAEKPCSDRMESAVPFLPGQIADFGKLRKVINGIGLGSDIAHHINKGQALVRCPLVLVCFDGANGEGVGGKSGAEFPAQLAFRRAELGSVLVEFLSANDSGSGVVNGVVFHSFLFLSSFGGFCSPFVMCLL